MRIWLDDERPMPAGYTHHARTAAEAIALLGAGGAERISLDHDLGDDAAGTGYTVACWIERAAAEGRLAPIGLAIHTANPVGRRNMAAALQGAKRHWMAQATMAEQA